MEDAASLACGGEWLVCHEAPRAPPAGFGAIVLPNGLQALDPRSRNNDV